MSELGIPVLKKSDQKILKITKVNVMWTKTNSDKLKFGSKNKTRLKMNAELIAKTIQKKSDPKNWKNSKNESEIAACERKTTSEKAIFYSNPVFSLYFKIRAKKVKTTCFFAPLPVSAWPKALHQFEYKNHETVWRDP